MKRLRHLLLRLAAGLSFLLFVGTAAVWVRSYWVRDMVLLFSEHDTVVDIDLVVPPGALDLIARTENHRTPEAPRMFWVHTTDPPGDVPQMKTPATRLHLLGFRYESRYGASATETRIRSPLWFLSFVFSLPVAAWIWYRRRAPRSPNQCTHCGYDLRATPDRCPECGAVVEEPGPKEESATSRTEPTP
jgi:hypothetical protein